MFLSPYSHIIFVPYLFFYSWTTEPFFSSFYHCFCFTFLLLGEGVKFAFGLCSPFLSDQSLSSSINCHLPSKLNENAQIQNSAQIHGREVKPLANSVINTTTDHTHTLRPTHIDLAIDKN